ncbi:MAG: hypothetical protein EOO62_19520 [Hymenobacter sp.]|nr:MAG: hypothetical protein EOO62_19520 [Hymenobacter sp.]
MAGAAHTHLLTIVRRVATGHALSARNHAYTVTATAYEAVVSQTDSEPLVTADNSRIPRGYGSHTRWLALSRDLLRPWGGSFEFGDKVRVQGISPALDGVYTVHDTMNRRYRHCLDVLVHPREHVTISRTGVKVQRISPSQPLSSTSILLTSLRTAHKKPVAHQRTRTHRAVAQHVARTAKHSLHPKHSPRVAHQNAAKHQLATLPKYPKKRVVAQVHHSHAA